MQAHKHTLKKSYVFRTRISIVQDIDLGPHKSYVLNMNGTSYRYCEQKSFLAYNQLTN